VTLKMRPKFIFTMGPAPDALRELTTLRKTHYFGWEEDTPTPITPFNVSGVSFSVPLTLRMTASL